MNEIQKKEIVSESIIYAIILLAIASRFIPHMPNFAPITALAIFSASQLGWKKSLGLTLVVRFVSDLYLGFFAWPLMVAVYASHLVGVLFGSWMSVGGVKWLKIAGSSIGASLVFFLATNFAFLYSNYSHNFSGIIQAYVNGLPFLRGTLFGDLFYSVAFFGSMQLAVYLVAKFKNKENNITLSPGHVKV
jgi:hypothetical protein